MSMQRSVPVLVLLVLTLSVSAQSVHRDVLPNGLTVITLDQRHTHVVEVLVLVRAGPTSEGALLGTGVSKVLQGVMVDGARSQIDQLARIGNQLRPIGLERVGARFPGYSGFSLATTDDHLEDSIKLLAELIIRPNLDEAVLTGRMGMMAANDRRALRAAGSLEAEGLRSTIYRVHPLGLPVDGHPEQRGTLNLDDVRRYHADRYTASNTTVFVIGNIDQGDVKELVAEAFAEQPVGSWAPPPAVAEPVQFSHRTKVISADVDAERHSHAWRVSPRSRYRDQAVLELVAILLGEALEAGLSPDGAPPLASGLRVEHVANLVAPGYLVVSYDPVPDTDAFQVLKQELDRLRSDGPSPTALAAAKRLWKRNQTQELATVHGLALDLATWEASVGEPSFGKTFRDTVEAVTVEEVIRVVNSQVHPKGHNRSSIFIQPDSEDEVVEVGPPEGEDPPVADARQVLGDVRPRIETLPNGVRYLRRYMPIGLAQVRVTIGGGSSIEDPAEQGAASVLAQVRVSGSEGRSGDDLVNRLRDHGMSFSVKRSDHAIDMHIVCFPDRVGDALEVLIDILRQPAISEGAVAAAVQSNQLGLGNEEDLDWDERLRAALRGTLLAGHYAARNPLGNKDSLAALGPDQVLALHRRLTVGGNVVVSMYGQFDDVATIEALQKLNERQPQLAEGPVIPLVGSPWPAEEPVALTTIDVEPGEAALGFGWRAPAIADRGADGPAMDVLTALLVGNDGQGGRIGRALAPLGVEVGTDQLQAGTETFAARGVWTVRVQVEDEQVDNVRKLVPEVVAGLLGELASEAAPEGGLVDEITAAKALSANRRILASEDQGLVSRIHAQRLLRGESIEHDLAYRNRVQSVEQADLLRVGQTYLDRFPVVVQLLPPAQEPVDAPVKEPGQEPVKEPSPPAAGAADTEVSSASEADTAPQPAQP
jgi:predicted Zn-dependent peptidase